MMSIFEKNLRIPLHYVILFLFLFLTTIFILIFYSLSPENSGWTNKEGYLYVIAVGMVPALVVAIIQYLLEWFQFRELSRLRTLKIKTILMSRDDQSYYGQLVSNAQENIDLMGVTAYRFLEDFAASTSPKSDRKLLISALDRKVKVRILIASKEHLKQDGQIEKFTGALRRLEELQTSYPALFEFAIYQHSPCHTVFRVDEECLVGPQFPNLPSKDTPTVHTVCDGTFAKPYLQYFEDEWNDATK
jgi:hypothetical protein